MPATKTKPKFKSENRGVKITQKKRDVHSGKGIAPRSMRKDEMTRDSIDYSIQKGEVHAVMRTYKQVPSGFSGKITTFKFANPGSKKKTESICKGLHDRVVKADSKKKKTVAKRGVKKNASSKKKVSQKKQR